MICYEQILSLSCKIKECLQKSNVKFETSMITNGTLLDEERIKQLLEIANLKKIQITLDGDVNNYCLKKCTNPQIYYVLLIPKQYTITFNPNVSSQPANSLVNSGTYTKSVFAYYNELPENIAVMPQGNYYIPIAYGLGIDYFDSVGQAQHFYDFSGDTTMNCSWQPIKYQV